MLKATVRQQVTVPLRFADGYATTARVMTFDGLVDGGAPGPRPGRLAARADQVGAPAAARRWSGRTASA